MKMKRMLLPLLAAASLLAVSCESLDYTPGNQMSDATFWKTEVHARQAAIGLYAAMKEPWCFGMEFTFEMCGDLADGTSPWADVSRGTSFASGSGGVQNHWQYLYELVHRCNTVMRGVAGMDISPETISRVTGEARFLRAMAYFRMLQCWGGVPYYDETCDINKEFATLDNPRVTADELRGHILDDLGAAIASLPAAPHTPCAARCICLRGCGTRPGQTSRRLSKTSTPTTAIRCTPTMATCSDSTTGATATR